MNRTRVETVAFTISPSNANSISGGGETKTHSRTIVRRTVRIPTSAIVIRGRSGRPFYTFRTSVPLTRTGDYNRIVNFLIVNASRCRHLPPVVRIERKRRARVQTGRLYVFRTRRVFRIYVVDLTDDCTPPA